MKKRILAMVSVLILMLMVQCYDHEKLQMYSKIMSKW